MLGTGIYISLTLPPIFSANVGVEDHVPIVQKGKLRQGEWKLLAPKAHRDGWFKVCAPSPLQVVTDTVRLVGAPQKER